jgi:hypothetical protein
VASHEDLDCAGLEFRADNTLLDDHSKDESTDGVEIQSKLCSTTEQGLNPDGCPVRHSDDSPEYEEKQSFVLLYDGEKIHVNETADELASCDEHEGSPKLHGPERLLSTRKVKILSQIFIDLIYFISFFSLVCFYSGHFAIFSGKALQSNGVR